MPKNVGGGHCGNFYPIALKGKIKNSSEISQAPKKYVSREIYYKFTNTKEKFNHLCMQKNQELMLKLRSYQKIGVGGI